MPITLNLSDDEIGILTNALDCRDVNLRIGKARSQSEKGQAKIKANAALRSRILAAWRVTQEEVI